MSSNGSKIIAIGDLHGDSGALLAVADALGLITAGQDWIADNVHLVQMGDVCDRGTDSRTIYDLLMRWQRQAPELGSEISFLIGNHEAMNAFGYRQYVNPLDFEGYADSPESSGDREYAEAFAEGGWLFEWLVRQHAVVKAGPFIFGHGDLPVLHMNLAWQDFDVEIMKHFLESPKNLPPDLLPAILFSEDQSVLWCRQAQSGRIANYGKLLEEFLAGNDASVYVCGHTPSGNGQFKVLHDGRYLCIDTAMIFREKGFGTVSAFVYENDTASAFYSADGSERREPLALSLPEPQLPV